MLLADLATLRPQSLPVEYKYSLEHFWYSPAIPYEDVAGFLVRTGISAGRE